MGLDPRVHLLWEKFLLAKVMDRRVKPGDDGSGGFMCGL
jgi:hypothetical protein